MRLRHCRCMRIREWYRLDEFRSRGAAQDNRFFHTLGISILFLFLYVSNANSSFLSHCRKSGKLLHIESPSQARAHGCSSLGAPVFESPL